MDLFTRQSFTTGDLRRMIREMPVPMYISSNDPAHLHRFIDVNDALVEHSGYSREELMDMIVFDLLEESFFQNVTYDYQEMMQKRFMTFESLHKTKEGKTVPVDVSVRIVETESGEPVNVVQYYDSSKKQETERLLEKMHQQLESLFQFNPDLTFMLNVQGFFTNVNPAGLKLFGYAKTELYSKVYTDVVYEEDIELAINHFQKIMEQKVTKFELRIWNRNRDIRLLDVTAVPIMESGRVTGVIGTARDITEQKAVERQLAESRQRYQSIFENNIDAVLTFDLKGRFQYINPATEQMMGYSAQELIGTPFLPHIVPDRQAYTIARFSNVMEGEAIQYETAMYTKSKDIVELHVTIIPILVNGTITGLHYIGKDITEKKLNEMAFQDYLTKLPNQHYFHQYLQGLIESCKQENASFAVLFLDLDRFKSVNDAFGHDFGDLLLVATANRLTMHLPASARVFRYGGDELIITLEGAGEEEAARAARQVLQLFKEPFVLNDIEITASMSIGVSLFPQDGADRETLVKKADHAMYFAKREGKQQYQFYQAATRKVHDQFFKIEPLLKKAIRNQELSLVYQPQVNMKTKRVHGVEALLRWHNEDIGSVSPAEFISIAEESGLIVEIGAWVIRTTCLQMKEWQANGMRPVTVSVNVSIRQFYHTDFVETLENIIKETGIDPRFLELEITESIASNGSVVISILQQLKQLGVHVSIDDFGTGYSSLRYLREFPIDGLKIDQSFIHDMTDGRKGQDIVSTIVTLAHNLDLIMIAEGTETEGQVLSLEKLGCDVAQGYYFSRPVPAEECLNWIVQWEQKAVSN